MRCQSLFYPCWGPNTDFTTAAGKPQPHHKTCIFSFMARSQIMAMTAIAAEDIDDRLADAYQRPALDSKRFRNSFYKLSQKCILHSITALEASLKCSHTARMLRFCVDFCLVLERNLIFLRWLVIFYHESTKYTKR
jgi:hypothetical protein